MCQSQNWMTRQHDATNTTKKRIISRYICSKSLLQERRRMNREINWKWRTRKSTAKKTEKSSPQYTGKMMIQGSYRYFSVSIPPNYLEREKKGRHGPSRRKSQKLRNGHRRYVRDNTNLHLHFQHNAGLQSMHKFTLPPKHISKIPSN